MCPRPIAVAKVSITAELENFVTPKAFDNEQAEKKPKKSANFFIGDEEDNFSSDEGYSDSEAQLTDNNHKMSLSIRNYFVDNTCLHEETIPFHLEANFGVEAKQPQVTDQVRLVVQVELNKRPLSSALRVPNSTKNGAKKSVRFSDSVGLDLVHVKLFRSDVLLFDECFNLDHMLPSSATKISSFASWKAMTSAKIEQRQLLMRFPSRSKETIFELVEAQNVCLASASCKGTFVSGTIQVKNIAFEKQVKIRYTLDGWGTYVDMPCTFALSNIAENQDSFSFSLCLPTDLPIGSSCEMSVEYSAAGQTFWDNNNGGNYKLDCRPLSSVNGDYIEA